MGRQSNRTDPHERRQVVGDPALYGLMGLNLGDFISLGLQAISPVNIGEGNFKQVFYGETPELLFLPESHTGLCKGREGR